MAEIRLAHDYRATGKRALKVGVYMASSLGCVLGSNSTAYASGARMAVMQDMRGVDDDTQVFRYNGLIGVKKHVSLELGHANTALANDNGKTLKASVGGIVASGSLHFGAYLSRNDWLFTESQAGGAGYSLFDAAEASLTGGTKQALKEPQKPVEFLFGMGLGGDSTLGFRLAYASYKNESHAEDVGIVAEESNSADQMEIGFGFHSSGSNAIDISATLTPSANQKASEKTGASETSLTVKGGTKVKFDARWLENEKQSGIYGAGSLMNSSAKATTAASGIEKDGKYTDQVMAAEAGYNFIAEAAKATVAGEIVKSQSTGPTLTVSDAGVATFSFANNTEKAKYDTLQLNGKFGGEAANLYSNFGLMAGMSYVIYGNQTRKDNTTGKNITIKKTINETSDSSLWTLGAFYGSGPLRVDAVYSRNFLYNGPFLISGNATSPWLARLSASYQL